MKLLKYTCVKVAGQKPKERSGHRIISDDDGVIYSFGGFNPSNASFEGLENQQQQNAAMQKSLFKELWRFDPIRKDWTLLETTGQHPEQVASHAAVYFRNHLIIYGGTGYPFGQTSTNRIFLCNLKTLVWSQLTPSNPPNCPHLPIEMYGQSIVADAVNECLYAVGGTTGFTYSVDVHRFDLKTRKWTELFRKTHYDEMEFPAERYRHETVLHNDKIYVFGGGNATSCCSLKYLPVFDLKSNTWLKVKTNSSANSSTFPQKRKCHGCVVARDQSVYIFGGNSDPSHEILNDIWRFNLETFTWSPIAVTMRKALFFFGITITPADKVYIFGGVTNVRGQGGQAPTRLNDLYEIWLSVPPLQELAWQTLVEHKEEVSAYVDPLSLPQRFLDRINYGGSRKPWRATQWKSSSPPII